MRPLLRLRWIVVLVVCVSACLAGVALSNSSHMDVLPVHDHFKCKLCHASTVPSAQDLNNFGLDFKANGYVWNNALAKKDSDGDGYLNGIELGDETGDGIPEISVERSNPGDPLNYPNSIDKATWSAIKNLFEEN